MAESIDVRKAVKKAIDDALGKPVKGESLGEVVERAVELAIRTERARFEGDERVEGKQKKAPPAAPADFVGELSDIEVKSEYII